LTDLEVGIPCRRPGSLTVGLATIHHEPIGSANPIECLAQEQFAAVGSPGTEQKCNRIAIAVDSTMETFLFVPDFDVRFEPLGR